MSESTTEQPKVEPKVEPKPADKKTTEQVSVTPPELRNPEGKGGFGEHPENINAGGRPKNPERYGYWLEFFKGLSSDEFKQYPQEHPDMTMAALAAYARIGNTVAELKEFQEVANRTEGMPKQSLDLSTPEGFRLEISKYDNNKVETDSKAK